MFFPLLLLFFDTSLFMKSLDQTLKLYNSPFDRGDKSCAFLEVRRKFIHSSKQVEVVEKLCCVFFFLRCVVAVASEV
jgi:hypothetical protein